MVDDVIEQADPLIAPEPSHIDNVEASSSHTLTVLDEREISLEHRAAVTPIGGPQFHYLL